MRKIVLILFIFATSLSAQAACWKKDLNDYWDFIFTSADGSAFPCYIYAGNNGETMVPGKANGTNCYVADRFGIASVSSFDVSGSMEILDTRCHVSIEATYLLDGYRDTVRAYGTMNQSRDTIIGIGYDSGGASTFIMTKAI